MKLILCNSQSAATEQLRSLVLSSGEECSIACGGDEFVDSQIKRLPAGVNSLIFVGDVAKFKRMCAKSFNLAMYHDQSVENHVLTYAATNGSNRPAQYALDMLSATPENCKNVTSVRSMQCAAYGKLNDVWLFFVPDDKADATAIFDGYVKTNAGPKIDRQVLQYKIFATTPQEVLDKTANLANPKTLERSCFSTGELDCLLTLKLSPAAGEKFAAQMDEHVKNLFGNYIYSTKNQRLEAAVVETFSKVGKRFASAESLTGGLIADKIVSVPGASAVFHEGLVTYTISAKCRRLGISSHFVDRYGVVSSEVAHEMAKGLLGEEIDFSVATTGYAGPTADDGYPVGLTYIAVGTPQGVKTFRNVFAGDRDQIRQQAANSALFLLLNAVKTKI